jgi:ribosomal protein S18 acetylase RimI-like enzyme
MNQECGVVRLDAEQAEARIGMIVEAFRNDAVMRMLRLPERAMRRMYALPVELGIHHGEVYASSPAAEGVMVIVPGERSVFRMRDVLASGSLGNALGMIRVLFNRHMRKMFTIVEEDHKKLDIGPYWYLSMIAVAPEHQGCGHGSRLLRHLCARADREGKAIYLETQTAQNAALYEHFGFTTVRHVEITDGIELWEMVRPGGSARGAE